MNKEQPTKDNIIKFKQIFKEALDNHFMTQETYNQVVDALNAAENRLNKKSKASKVNKPERSLVKSPALSAPYSISSILGDPYASIRKPRSRKNSKR